MDYTSSRQRAGSPGLFAAIARARPQLHCFGRIRDGWGAKNVAWNAEPSEVPSHFTDIDNDECHLLESLSNLNPQKFDDKDRTTDKTARRATYSERGYCSAEAPTSEKQMQTLFVNAAIEGDSDEEKQWPWMVDLQLPLVNNHDLAD